MAPNNAEIPFAGVGKVLVEPGKRWVGRVGGGMGERRVFVVTNSVVEVIQHALAWVIFGR